MEENPRPHDDQQGDWSSGTKPDWDSSANPTDAAPESTVPKSASGREMLVQLQQMIDTIATQASPVMRDVAAKAAELAAVAGQKAGPLAYKAAEVTESLGQRMAARSKDFAAEMRRAPEEGGAQTPSGATAEAMTAIEPATDAEPAQAPASTAVDEGPDAPRATDSPPWS